MSILKFKKVNCKNCCKCVRYCPVKSIEIKDGQAQIIEEECILCGNCTVVCPQNAKEPAWDIPEIKRRMKNGQRMVASVAPSFVAEYEGVSFESFKKAIIGLGFEEAFETAEGAYIVKSQYENLLDENNESGENGKSLDIVISSCCHTVVDLIKKRHPDMIEYLAPVLSPMETHAKLLKDERTRIKDASEVQIVFMGPCISKKAEALEKNSHTDFAITFDELNSWLIEENLEVRQDLGGVQYLSRLFPTVGGILNTMSRNPRYNYITVDEIEGCEDVLEAIRVGKLNNCFIEMSACKGSCIGGPTFRRQGFSRTCGEIAVQNSAVDTKKIETGIDYSRDFNLNTRIDTRREYERVLEGVKTPNDSEVKEILKKMGKNSESDQLNCGTCGYDTCMAKAAAIFQGKAEISMCLPFMKERAESISDKIINATPNIILAVDIDLNVIEINQSAIEAFGIGNEEIIIGTPVTNIIDEFPFIQMIAEDKLTEKRFAFEKKYGLYLAQDYIYDQPNGIIICVMKNITAERIRKNKIKQSRIKTAKMADRLVEEQLRIVHEIASLLGETAADTKVAVHELKNAILLDEDEVEK